MKKVKKLLSLIVAAVMVIAMAVPTFADAGKTTITITDATNGSTYVAYKILNATNNGENYAYTMNATYKDVLISTLNTLNTPNTPNLSADAADKDIIGRISGLTDTRTFADSLYRAIKAKTPDAAVTAANDKAVFNVDQGYYLIAQTVKGNSEDTFSLVMLYTAGKTNIDIKSKKDKPELTKKVMETNDSTGYVSGWQDGADYDIGDLVPFQLTGTLPSDYASYSQYKYVFHDKMSAGLTYNSIESVKVVDASGKELATITDDFTVIKPTTHNTDKCNLEFACANLKTISAANQIDSTCKIVVTYKAELNKNAVIGSAGNPNTAYLEYSNNPYSEGTPTTSETPEDAVIVFTYQITANKVDKNGQALNGAGFTLFKYDKKTEDYVAVGTEIKGTEENPIHKFEFKNADAGQYKLVETTVPEGYNKADDIEFKVVAIYDTDSVDPKLTSLKVTDLTGKELTSFTVGKNGNDGSYTFTGDVSTNIVNQSGSLLPSTGGMGTKILYTVGVILVLGAGIVLVTRKRVSDAAK